MAGVLVLRKGVVGRGLSNFLLFVFHVGRGPVGWTTIAQRVCGSENAGTKDRRDIVLAIYIYQSPAHTSTQARACIIYIYIYMQM
jgi:hypothetical protein